MSFNLSSSQIAHIIGDAVAYVSIIAYFSKKHKESIKYCQSLEHRVQLIESYLSIGHKKLIPKENIDESYTKVDHRLDEKNNSFPVPVGDLDDPSEFLNSIGVVDSRKSSVRSVGKGKKSIDKHSNHSNHSKHTHLNHHLETIPLKSSFHEHDKKKSSKSKKNDNMLMKGATILMDNVPLVLSTMKSDGPSINNIMTDLDDTTKLELELAEEIEKAESIENQLKINTVKKRGINIVELSDVEPV